MKGDRPMTSSIRSIALLASLTALSACSWLVSPEKSIQRTHPEKLPPGRPTCSDCHEGTLSVSLKPYAAFNHSDLFVRDHRGIGAREEIVCTVCHSRSFCADCHAGRGEMKPSVKLGDRPDRELVHRGDYLTRHRIDGKRDPASCFRCHGRTNNALCQSCHK